MAGGQTMGHYCYICGRTRSNEKFSGKGHKKHICKDCSRKPKAIQEKMIKELENERFELDFLFSQGTDTPEEQECYEEFDEFPDHEEDDYGYTPTGDIEFDDDEIPF